MSVRRLPSLAVMALVLLGLLREAVWSVSGTQSAMGVEAALSAPPYVRRDDRVEARYQMGSG